MFGSLVFSSFLLLCLLFSSQLSSVHGGEEYVEANVGSLFMSETCSSHKASGEKGSSSLRISHRHGPCSSKGSNMKQATLLQELLHRDQLRVASLNDRVLNSSSFDVLGSLQVSLPARKGRNYDTGNYVISVGIGTPARTQTVIFDTGSTVSWVQCQPCLGSCHPQADPIFDPERSATYRNLTCNSIPCSLLSGRGCTRANTCLYDVLYGDGSSTVGYLAKDKLTLTPSSTLPTFVFGCGQNNQGLFGFEAGLFGLSRNPLSLASQLSATSRSKAFSYCLPSLSSGTGDLTFGPVSTPVFYTPLVTDPRAPSLYFLQLSSISVGGVVLPIRSSVFANAGTLIDSGTVVTRLPKTAYSALRRAFRKGMTRYKLSDGVSILDTCYDFTGLSTVTVPTVVLKYGGGVTVKLGFGNIMIGFDIAHVCLAFAGNSDDVQLGILGNVQQASQRVVYDVGLKRVGFGVGTCG